MNSVYTLSQWNGHDWDDYEEDIIAVYSTKEEADEVCRILNEASDKEKFSEEPEFSVGKLPP